MSLPYASHRALIATRRHIDAATAALANARADFLVTTPAYQSNAENRGDFEQLKVASSSLADARSTLLSLCMADAMRESRP